MATSAQVQQLYIALLGRAADKPGLDWWLENINGTEGVPGERTLEQAAAAFTTSEEFLSTYGSLQGAELVTAVYKNLFERTPSQDEVNYWVNDGRPADELLQAFLTYASPADQAVIDNKVTVAQAYTEAAGSEIDLDAAAAIIAGVDGTVESVDAALAQIGEELGVPGDTFSLTEALAAQEAGELPEAYELTDGDLTLEEAVSVADARAALNAAQAVIANAANEAPVELNATYTLADTLENLENAPEIVAGAESYSLTDDALTAAAVEGVTVAGLEDAQAAAVQAVRDNPVVAGATNGSEIPVNNGPYSLNDDAALLLAADADVLAGADVVTVNNETLTREQFDALNALENVNLDLEGVDVENTAPEAAAATSEVAEDATFEGQLEATDPDVADQGDELTFALAEGQEAVEGFTLNADGSYSFDAAQEAFQALQVGDTQDVVINYTVTDSEGATSTNTLTLTVTGTDDAPAVAIAEGTENDLLTEQVFGAEDAITDVDGFGGGATVTLSYDEAVEAAGQYGTPSFKATYEFRVVRDGNEFTLIAKAGQNGFTTATTIGTVTPVGVTEVLDAEGDVTGYTQTGYTLELNDKVTPEVLTALLQEWNVQEAADGSNTQLTVSIASQGGAEPVEFVRNIKGADAGAVSLAGTESALEAELTAGALNTEAADKPFAPFSNTVDFDGGVAAIAGMEATLASTNAADAFLLAADNGSFEAVDGQLIVKGSAIGRSDGDDDLVVGNINGLGTAEVTISLRENLPAGFDQEDINALLQNLLIDLEDATGDRTVSLNVTSGDGLSEASLTRDISVLGAFTAVNLQDIADADAESVVTIDGNTILNVGGFDSELDIQAQIDAGNLVVEGTNPIRIMADANADLSKVAGLELLGDLRIQQVAESTTLTLDATQVDFLSTAGKVAGNIAVTGLEGNTDADLSVLEAAGGVTATISAEAGDVTFTGDFGTAEVTVGDNSTLTATAAILDGVTVTGNVVVTDLDGEAAYDLSKIAESATATLASGETTTLNADTDLGTVAVTVPQNSELVLTAKQADGAKISGGDVTGDGNKGGSVTVLGLSDGIDLSGISASEILAGAVNALQSDLIVTFRAEDEEAEEGVIENVTLNAFIVQVQEGATLRIDQGTANGAIIIGAGNVEVTVAKAEALDLSKITATGSKTVVVGTNVDLSKQTVDFGDFAVNVAAGTTLTLTAAQASGLSITGADADAGQTGGSIVVALDGEAAYDLSSITAGSLTAVTTAIVKLAEDTNLGGFSLEIGGDLTLSAAQADGRSITGDGHAVVVNDLAADTDLSNVAEEITVTANVAESIDISANENLTTVDTFVVANDAVLTLSARQANAQVVELAADDSDETTAAPAVVIAGPVALEEGETELALDFSNVEAFTFQGDELVIGDGVTVTLTAAQADGKVITGAGNVVVTELGDAAVDLSGITVTGTKTANVEDSDDNAVTLNAATDLGDFTLNVQAGNTLTLTAAQAATAVLVGEGAAVINGTATGETLDYSAKADWTIDTLTINGGGGADVLEAPQNVANVTLVGGTGGDIFVVNGRTTTLEGVTLEPVTIGDFNFNSDELVIADSGEATLDLSTATGLIDDGFDLAKLETLGRYSNAGMLNVTVPATATLNVTAAQLANLELANVDGTVTVDDSSTDSLTVAQARALLEAGYNGSYSVEDTVANLTDEVGDLSGAASVTVKLAADGTDADLSGVALDDDVTAIDLNGQNATLSIEQAGLTLSDSSGQAALADRDITIADAFGVTVTYSDLTADSLGVNSVMLDDNDNAATIDFADAGIVNGAANTVFAAEDAITVTSTDVTGTDDITTLDAAEIGGASVTIDEVDGDNAYTLTAAKYETAFVTNGLSAAEDDTITVTGVTEATQPTTLVATAAKDVFQFGALFESAATITGFDTEGADTIDLSGVNAATVTTEVTGELTTAADTVYFLGNQTAGAADSAEAAASAVDTAAAWTDADADAFIVIADDDSSAIYKFTDTANSGDGVAAGELILVGTVDAVLTAGDIAIA